MALLKCKMCGGDLDIVEGSTVCVCEYCGTKQTVPSFDSEKKITLFARANRLRFASEFDKAYSIYETILIDYPEEAEAYWGLVLCKYGIEYVDDPNSAKKIPTCHRSSFDSIFDDPNYEQVIENSDIFSRVVYREEAKAIEEIRKGIVEISSKEEPYDIFICYKETDENGDRTLDSLIAQDVYDALTKKGYRVFFSRITLEDKLGKEYEPYIFSALHSAKIMLAFGTDYEYYNSVWVKNEWSRFLKLIENDKEKVLIPCYKGLDAYDMPKEFLKLQSQDMGKVGAIQDLLRGIDKILSVKQEKETIIVNQQAGVSEGFFVPILKKAQYQLENRQFEEARKTYQKVLDFAPNNQDALIGTLLCAMGLSSLEELENGTDDFRRYKEYDDINNLCNDEIKKIFKEALLKIKNNNETKAKNALEAGDYQLAKRYANNLLAINSEDGNARLFLLLAELNVKSLDELAKGTAFFDESKISNKASDELKENLEKALISIKQNNCSAIIKCISKGDYQKAKSYFENVNKRFPNDKDVIDASICLNYKVTSKDNIYKSESPINKIKLSNELSKKSEEYKAFFEKAKENQKQYYENEIEVALKKGDYSHAKNCSRIFVRCDPSNGKAYVNLLLSYSKSPNIESLPCNSYKSKLFKLALDKTEGETKKQLLCKQKEFIEKRKKKTCISAIASSAGVVSAILVVVLLVSSVIIFFSSNYFKYGAQIENGGITITTYRTIIPKEKVKIPERIMGLKVLKIGDEAFLKHKRIDTIVIPKSVTTIGNYAFCDCDSLKSIVIPNSVTTIGDHAFCGCDATIYFEAEDVPSNWDEYWYRYDINYANDNYFYCPSYRGSHRLVYGVKDADTTKDGFSYVVKNDDTCVITGFTGTSTKIEIPSTIDGYKVTSIGDYAFSNCDSLESIVIPNGVTTIGDYAFSNCDFLKSVAIPNSVTTIGVYAFCYCFRLQSIEIPNSVTTIGDSAFSNCYSLESIVIPNSVTTIGYNAFAYCNSLESIVIPNSVTEIGEDAFANCYSLTIYCEAESKPSGWDYNWNYSNRPVEWGVKAVGTTKDGFSYMVKNDDTCLITGYTGTSTKIEIPSTIDGYVVTSIGDYAFSNCDSLKSIEIPNSVTTIGDCAFYDCFRLQSIVIPNSVTTIGDYAFSDCDSLKSIEIPNSVTTIGIYAFYECHSLESIVIPNSVTTIGERAFAYCNSLESIEIPNSVTTIGDYAFYCCWSLKSIVIPNSVTEIGEYAFSNCGSLESIEIPNSVTTIGDYAFYDCSLLESIVIPNSVTTIGDYAFSNCASLKSIVIPNGVTTIGDSAFSDCDSLKSIVIPNSVTEIGEYAFVYCYSLTIYCEAESKPSGWDYNWNSSNCPVEWGYQEN